MKIILPKGASWRPPLNRCLLGCLAACALLLDQRPVSANPADQPARVINYQQVDLMPLFTWWERPQGVRPLTSWKHIEGSLERETAYGWLVRGSVEGQPGLQFLLLRSPPRTKISRFHELTEQLPQLEQGRASALAITRLPQYNGWYWDEYGGLSRTPTADFDRIEQARANLKELDERIATARAELADMLDKRGSFKVDVFALQLNLLYQGNQVFDFGFPPF